MPWLLLCACSLSLCRYIVIQMFLAWYLKDSDSRTLLLVAYGVGGLINHALSLAIHVRGLPSPVKLRDGVRWCVGESV